jgi:hypothetical protein
VNSTPVSPQSSESTRAISGSYNGVGESTWTTAQPKTKKRESPVYDGEEYDSVMKMLDDQVALALALEWESRKNLERPISTPKKANSTPVSPQYSTPGFTFNNDSGNMSNVNVGNVYNSTTPVSPHWPGQYSPQNWPQNSTPGSSYNYDSGNIHNSTISDSFNDNSVNVTGRRRLGPPADESQRARRRTGPGLHSTDFYP